jgi:sarcosine oxidase subunit beta
MTETADLVVVGAGIAGASVGFFAAQRGMRVVVIERGLPASGASGFTAGYIRCHYANPHEAHFAVESWTMHRQWADVVGGQSGFRRNGFLFIVPPALVPALEANVALMRRMGVPTEVLDAPGVVRAQPFLSPEGIGAAAWEPESGFADPGDSIGSLLAGLRAQGGQVRLETGPARLVMAGERVEGVRAGGIHVAAPRVVLAAGAGTRGLAAQAGVEVPVFPMPIGAGVLRRQVTSAWPMPACTIDHTTEQWYRGEIGDDLVIGAGYEDSIGFSAGPEEGDRTFAPPTGEELVAGAARLLSRMPDLERAAPGRTWVGVDSRTPDGHAIAGPLPGVEGLYVLTGGNGKGFKFGPSMGRALAAVVAGEPWAASALQAFGLERFATGQTIRGAHEYAWGSFA